MGEREAALLVAELAETGLAAASLVHELRQPMFAIKALAQMARRADGLRGAELEDLLTAVGHIEGLLDAWSAVGRREPVALYDLRQVAEAVARMLAPRLESSQATLVIAAGGPVWVEGSPGVARQVLLNLLQNAVDAVQDRDERTIDVTFVGGPLAGVVVADTGPGLPEHEGDVFAPFVTTKGDQGTGLGLYVIRALCTAAGGSLTVESSPTGARATALFVTPAAAAP